MAVVIPRQWLSVLGLAAGEQVEIQLEGNRLTLQAKPQSSRNKYKLADLLAKCDPDAPLPVNTEWENMPAVGREVW